MHGVWKVKSSPGTLDKHASRSIEESADADETHAADLSLGKRWIEFYQGVASFNGALPSMRCFESMCLTT